METDEYLFNPETQPCLAGGVHLYFVQYPLRPALGSAAKSLAALAENRAPHQRYFAVAQRAGADAYYPLDAVWQCAVAGGEAGVAAAVYRLGCGGD